MRNLADPNGRREEPQELSLAPDAVELNGEDAVMRDTNPHNPQRQEGLSPMSRCPMYALLEEVLDSLPIKESDFHHTRQPRPDSE